MNAFRMPTKDKEEDTEKLKSIRCVSAGDHLSIEAE